MQELFSLQETAPILRISEITLRRLIKKKAIPYHRIGKRYIFSIEDIDSFLKVSFIPIKDKENENT